MFSFYVFLFLNVYIITFRYRIVQQGIGGSCLKTNTLATGQNQIFISLKQGASCFSWGGEVYIQPTDLSPAMGSGHFPQEGYEKSAYITQIIVVINESAGYGDPPVDPCRLKISAAKPYCYNVIQHVGKAPLRIIWMVFLL